VESFHYLSSFYLVESFAPKFYLHGGASRTLPVLSRPLLLSSKVLASVEVGVGCRYRCASNFYLMYAAGRCASIFYLISRCRCASNFYLMLAAGRCPSNFYLMLATSGCASNFYLILTAGRCASIFYLMWQQAGVLLTST
jgi:hypothetical protein